MLNKNNNKKTKTICTIETSDIDLQDHKPASQMNIPCSRDYRHHKQKFQESPIVKRKSHLKMSTPTRTTHKFFYNTQKIQTKSPDDKEKNKSKSSLHRTVSRSKSRMKTDYSISSDFVIKSLFCKSAKKDKLYNPFEQHYQMDTYEIIEEVTSSKKQKVYYARKGDKFYLMKKTKDPNIKKQYETQHTVKLKLFHAKWKNLIKPIKMYSQKSWIYSIYEYHGNCLNWQNPSHVQVIQKLLKNEGVVLKFIIKEISKGINELSSKGYAHSEVRFENISMKIQQFKRTINVQGNVRLANLGHCFNIKDKGMLLKMPCSIYTPPQIINLKLFQNGDKFDRQLIQYISYYDEPWYVDVWALGVLTLQLIASQSISIEKAQRGKQEMSEQQEDDQVSFDIQKEEMLLKPKNIYNQHKQSARSTQITLSDILQAQKSLLIQTQSQIQKIGFDKTFQALLIRMLSVNPLNRPSPKQIIKDL